MMDFVVIGFQTFALAWVFGLAWGLLSLAQHLWEGKEF